MWVLYIGCIGTHATNSSSDVIVILKWRHHIMSHFEQRIQGLLGAFFEHDNAVFNGEQEKESISRVMLG